MKDKRNRPPKARKTIYTAFLSLRNDVKVVFCIAFFSVLFIEIFLKNFEAPTQTFYRVGDIYLKICYSIVATTIFFFINQQIPKEQKKIKTYLYIHNRIGKMLRGVSDIFSNLKFALHPDEDLTELGIRDKLMKIDPTKPVKNRNNEYANWRAFIIDLRSTNNKLLNELIPLHDNIDLKLFECLVILDASFTTFETCDPRIYESEEEWVFQAKPLLRLYRLRNMIVKLLDKKYKYTRLQANEDWLHWGN